MKKIFCIGHAVYDITLPMEKFPNENSKNRVNFKIECGGGSASNAAVLLSRWHNNTYFIGTIGDDYYGRIIKKDFINNNVNVKYLSINKNVDTSTSYIIASHNNGKRTILTYADPNLKSLIKNVREKPSVIMVDGNDYDIAIDILDKNKDAISVIDAGSFKENTVKLAHKVKYLVCSKDFAEGYTGIKINSKDLDSITEVYKLMEKDFHNIIVITLEGAGSFAKINEEYKLIPSIKVDVVDSTGAGDIYHGAFTHFISHGYSLEDTMKYSNITGALSLTQLGSRNSIPLLDEILNYDK